MRALLSIAALAMMVGTSPIQAEQHQFRVTYLNPANPQSSMFVVDGLPSFLFMAGATIWNVGSSGSQLSYGAGASTISSKTGDLDCSDFTGEVDVSAGDPNNLDADHDRVGCERN
jgi:hypothetical protein